ncbi:MAG: hypothetical protein CM15mV52_0310 [uncultured marine virus]|nr:MAG: hypothetical protein CM15mV52_0310 [uncultured marine virus]
MKRKSLYEKSGMKWLMNTLGATVAVFRLLTRLMATTLSWVRAATAVDTQSGDYPKLLNLVVMPK